MMKSFSAVLLLLASATQTHAFTQLAAPALIQRSAAKIQVAMSSEGNSNEEGAPKQPSEAATPPSSLPPQVPPVPQPRMDPLIASLTRMDASAQEGQTTKLPFFGEVPNDKGLSVLAPVVAFAVIGFVLSFVTIIQQSDQIANSVMHVGDNMAKIAADQPNQVYADSCRGICSTQESDVDGLKKFMESISSPK